MGIQIAQERQGEVRILALSGRLDTETAADVELVLQDLLAAGENRFLFDLSGVGYVSSAGLRVLLALAKKLAGGKGDLKLCGLNASVKQVFDVAGFSKLFAIFANRDAALGQMPRLAPEVELAQQAARLLAVAAPSAPSHAQAEALARAAASVFGLQSAAPASASGISLPAITPVRVAPAPKTADGFLAKLKNWFGKS